MASPETVLAVTVDVVSRSDAPDRPTELPAAIERAHVAVLRLADDRPAPSAPDDDWSDRLLKGAWEITRAAHRRGTDLATLLDTLALVRDALLVAGAGPRDRRRRRRRDA